MFSTRIDITVSALEAELLGHLLILKKLQSKVQEIIKAKRVITKYDLEKMPYPKASDQREPLGPPLVCPPPRSL